MELMCACVCVRTGAAAGTQGNEGRLGRASSHCALHLGVNSKNDENPLFESSFPGYDGSIFVKGG